MLMLEAIYRSLSPACPSFHYTARIIIGPVCVFVCVGGFVCVFVGLLPR